ncbi:MAG TPA: CHASE2 domain-containing protein [Candidatus Methanoperedens sp.]|nr:CHASE2 domain-containing protein [Candidatus Methanoperedens sp.]
MAQRPQPEPLVLQRRRAPWRIAAAGTAFTVLVAAAVWHPPRTLDNLEGRIYDVFLRRAAHRPASGVPAVVDIDEESLSRYGQWPWPRYRIAQLLERLRELGPAAVAVDMVFAEPDRTSLPLIARERERDLGRPVRFVDPADAAADNDRMLADALARGPFVVGYAFGFGPGAQAPDCVLHPVALKTTASSGDGPGPARAPEVVCNLPELARAAGASGFFNVAPDPDGTLRRIPLLMEYRGELYPSLALAAIARARGSQPVALVSPDRGTPRLVVDGMGVPLDASGGMLLRFRGPGHGYEYLSAAAVLERRVPAGALAGRIAIVGTTAAGLKELRATPFDPVYPGPEVHAAAIDAILQGDFLQRPAAAHGWELLVALLAGALATAVLSRSGALAGLPLLIAGSAALWGGSYWLFAREGVFLSPLVPQTTLAGGFALLSFLRFRQSEREAVDFSRKLSLTQDVIIQSMAALAETRDNETGGHIQRTRHYVKALAESLRAHPRFRAFLDPETIELLFKLAPLHDIGKVGVRDHVLLKPERLTREEFEEMKRHTVYGDDTLEIAERRLGDDSFLRLAREFALTHQEKWDGSGYPNGLHGEQIPIAGRLMAVADVYDALVSRRAYKEPLTHERAAAVLAEGRGTHFDPDILDAFLANQDRFRVIAARFADRSTASLR